MDLGAGAQASLFGCLTRLSFSAAFMGVKPTEGQIVDNKSLPINKEITKCQDTADSSCLSPYLPIFQWCSLLAKSDWLIVICQLSF